MEVQVLSRAPFFATEDIQDYYVDQKQTKYYHLHMNSHEVLRGFVVTAAVTAALVPAEATPAEALPAVHQVVDSDTAQKTRCPGINEKLVVALSPVEQKLARKAIHGLENDSPLWKSWSDSQGGTYVDLSKAASRSKRSFAVAEFHFPSQTPTAAEVDFANLYKYDRTSGIEVANIWTIHGPHTSPANCQTITGVVDAGPGTSALNPTGGVIHQDTTRYPNGPHTPEVNAKQRAATAQHIAGVGTAFFREVMTQAKANL
jgi:hypothetical protein